MKKILFISLAIVLALSVGLIGCEGEEGEGEVPTDLRVVCTIEPSTVGFPLSNREAENFYTHPGIEALVKPAEDYWTSGDLVWILATSATPANNATEWTIELRTGVEFHDGSSWNASVCEFNIWLVNEFDRRSTFADVDTIDILGEHTIKLTFENPYPMFLYDLFDSMYPISQAAWLANVPDPEAGGDADISWFSTNCVGTGPFELESYELGKATWVPFDGYWGDAALLDSIEVTVIPNSTTAAAMMAAGDADLYVHADPEVVETLLAYGGFESRTNNELSKIGVFPSATSASSVYWDIEVRQALQHAINRVAIADALSASGVDYDPAYQLPMDWDTDGYDPDWGEDDEAYDPDAAIALLESVMPGEGLDGEYFATDCFLEGEGVENTIALLVQADLAAVNITMDLVVTSTRSMKTDAEEGWGDDNLMLSNYSWSPLPASSTLNWFNYGHDRMMASTYMSPEMEAIYDTMAVTYDVSTLNGLHGDMMQETRDVALGVFITNEVYASVFVDNLDTHWMLPYDRYWYCNCDVFESA